MSIETSLIKLVGNSFMGQIKPDKKIDFTEPAVDKPRQAGEVIPPEPSAAIDPPKVVTSTDEIVSLPVPDEEPISTETPAPAKAQIFVSPPAPLAPESEGAPAQWIKENLDPYSRLSISQAGVNGVDGVDTVSAEMQTTLNSRTPFAAVLLGLGRPNRLPPKYDLFGREREMRDEDIKVPFAFSLHDVVTDVYIVPNAELDLAKNYAPADGDYNLTGRAGFSVYIHTNSELSEKAEMDTTFEFYLRSRASKIEREWPSVSLPTGHGEGVVGGAALDLHLAPWLEGKPFAEYGINSFTYYEENFGSRDTTFSKGFRTGGEVFVKQSAGSYFPTIAVRGSTTLDAGEDIPDPMKPDGRQGKLTADKRSWNAGGGLYWQRGKETELHLLGEFERTELEGYNAVWNARAIVGSGSPSTGSVETTLSTGEGLYHYYSIRTPYSIALKWLAPDSLTLDVDGFRLRPGADMLLAKLKDMQRHGEEQILSSIRLNLEGSF